MKHKNMVIGKRYQLPHGTGVLLGHETFKKDGFEGPMSPTVNRNQNVRHVFMLDAGHNWQSGDYPYTYEAKKYCAWGKYIKKIKMPKRLRKDESNNHES